jgi:hypothetical protein
MLKVRTLGPEYLETQSQLRRDIRVQFYLGVRLGNILTLCTGNERPRAKTRRPSAIL